MIDIIFTLCMLVFLQAVLGFDNLLYISLASKQVEKEKQPFVRTVGISIAIILRVALLFILHALIQQFQHPVINIDIAHQIVANFSIHSLIVLGGGIFIVYTAIKEIWHMIRFDESEIFKEAKKKSIVNAIFWIVIMNLVFSIDSILSAMALSDNLWVMAAAIIIGGIMMIGLSGSITRFLAKNRMYEVLGLFILFVVGIMLISEGGELAEMELFDSKITHMSKATFYFVLFILVTIDVVQGRYQKKLTKIEEHENMME